MDKGYFDFAKYGSIGISWVLSTSIYLYLGYKGGTYLDGKLGSAPIFLLLGLLLAIGLSVGSLIGEIVALTPTWKTERRVQSDSTEPVGRALDREKNNNSSQEEDRKRRGNDDR